MPMDAGLAEEYLHEWEAAKSGVGECAGWIETNVSVEDIRHDQIARH